MRIHILALGMALLLAVPCSGGKPLAEDAAAGPPGASKQRALNASSETDRNKKAEEKAEENPFALSSPEFADGKAIPSKFSCDGKDISPALEWKNVPEGAKSLALIMDDPDAPVGLWVHWAIYDIPPDAPGLPEKVSPEEKRLKNGAVQGANSWKRIGYGGPCPPNGEHRYFFKLYALDRKLALKPGASAAEIEKAMKGRILGETHLMGRYRRVK